MNANILHNELTESGKTIRENNLELNHDIPLGTLVEIDCDYIDEHGLRLFVGGHGRDCDGTPLYSLTFDKHIVGEDFSDDKFSTITCPIEKHLFIADKSKFIHGFSSDILTIVNMV